MGYTAKPPLIKCKFAMDNIDKYKKLAFYPLCILAVLGYLADYLTGTVASTGEVNPLVRLATAARPYAFLFAVGAVLTLYTPHMAWKKIVIFGVLLFSFVAITLDVDIAFILINILGFLGILAFLVMQKTSNKFLIFGLGAGLVLTAALLLSGMQLSYYFTNTNETKALAISLLGLFLILAFPKTQLWKKVIVALVLGILLGFDLKDFHTEYFTTYLKLLGTIFLNLIYMIIAPLIFFSLVSGINNVNDSKSLGRIGTKATLVYTLTAMMSVALGLIIGTLANPAEGIDMNSIVAATAHKDGELPPLLKILMDFIPHNAMGAMAGADGKPHMVQIVFFAIFVGVTLNIMGEQGKRLVDFSHSAAALMFKMISYIIKLSPLAVFGLMAWVTATLGMDVVEKLTYLVAATIGAMGIHYLILGTMILVLCRLSPIPFYKKSLEYQALAFSTASSKATLATAMKVSENKLGVSKTSTSFILPLGAAINMDGTAIYLGLCSVFFAHIFGVPLDFHHYVLIIFAATIASMGAAGYPGGSIVVMSMVLDTIGVPAAGIPILLGVDRVLDMFRTTINITSDVAVLMVIDRSEGTLDEKRYYTPTDQLEFLDSKA